MNTTQKLCGLLLVASGLLLGCSAEPPDATPLASFSVISTANVRNLKVAIAIDFNQRVTGKACSRRGFGRAEKIAFHELFPTAVENAIKSGREHGMDGDLLVNAQFFRIYDAKAAETLECVMVEGNLVKMAE